ncbi:MAG: thioesterase [Anaerolineales bacterium]|nr:thioesterase [Anaerolineales bacterium]
MHIRTWFHCRKPNPDAQLRLLCFPYAGGGVSVFRAWPDRLPAEIEVWAIQLPGRDGRLREPIPADLPTLAAAIADGLGPFSDRPFACFGHSLGALLAFEFARELRRRGQVEPSRLLVSARRAPQLPRTEAPLHTLPEPQFIAGLQQRYNGIPAAILAEPELMQLFLPMLRADFKLIELYQYRAEAPLACPITAFGGAQDTLALPAELAAWQAQSHGAFNLQLFPGGHFYLQTALPQLLAAVQQALL